MVRMCTTCAINCGTEPCFTCKYHERPPKGTKDNYVPLPPPE